MGLAVWNQHNLYKIIINPACILVKRQIVRLPRCTMGRIQVVITSEAYVERSTVHFCAHMYCVPGALSAVHGNQCCHKF